MPLQLSIAERLAYTTVRIECETPEGLATGTGFYFKFCEEPSGRFIPALVTNRHVIEDGTKGCLKIHWRDNVDEKPSQSATFNILNFQHGWLQHPDPDIDLCVIPIRHLNDAIKHTGNHLFYSMLAPELIPNEESLSALLGVEDILMVGYPNGIWDDANNFPIFRRGITATHPNVDYCGRKEFLIDAAVFNGSSGSPVLLYNTNGYVDRHGSHLGKSRIMLLGILYAVHVHTATGEVKTIEIPTLSKSVAISDIPNHLGIVIKAEQLKAFEPSLQALIPPELPKPSSIS